MYLFRGLLLLLMVSSLFASGCAYADDYARMRKMNEVSREMAKERNQDIFFYGQVTDLDGAPIEGAEVKMRVRIFGARKPVKPFKEHFAVTDKKGYFSIQSFGEMITLDEIVKEGYVYHYQFNPGRSVHSVKVEKRVGLGYEPDKPIIFKIRKKGPPALLMSGGSGRLSLKSGESQYWDMYLRSTARESDLILRNMIHKDWHADVKVSVEEDVSGNRLVFESLDPDSGFFSTDTKFKEELIEAPEHGYKPKLVIPIKEEDAGHLYACVKNDGGLFYSRMTVRFSQRKSTDYVSLECHYSTNMTGDRGFESSIDHYMQYQRDEQEKKAPRLNRKNLRDGLISLPVLEKTQ